MNEQLPTRGPNDPPIARPHRIVHPDGTIQYVYGGPNMGRRRPRWLRVLGWIAFPLSLVAGAVAMLTWQSLTCSGRGAVVAVALSGILAHWAIRRTTRHRVGRWTA